MGGNSVVVGGDEFLFVKSKVSVVVECWSWWGKWYERKC